jgi:3'-phosphoadenosine 5'-phosphosulfate sulfotransferase (PAPS reductase)/FAD synthetase
MRGVAMGLTYSIEKELTTVIAEGSFSVVHVHAAFSKIRSEFDGSTPIQILIVDHGSEFEPSREEVQDLARGWGAIFRDVPVRIALLVDKDIHYGLGRMISVYAGQHDLPFDVFRHSLDALQWLSRDASANPPR